MKILKTVMYLSMALATIVYSVGLNPTKASTGYRRIANEQDKILASILSEKKAELEKRQKEIKELRKSQKEIRVRLAGAKSDEQTMAAVQGIGYFASGLQLIWAAGSHADDWFDNVSRPKFHHLKNYAIGLAAIAAIKGAAHFTEKRVREITAQLEIVDESLAELEETVKLKITEVSNLECRLLGMCRR